MKPKVITYIYYYDGVSWKTFADFNYGEVDDSHPIQILKSLDEPGNIGDVKFYSTYISPFEIWKSRLKNAWKVLTGEIEV